MSLFSHKNKTNGSGKTGQPHLPSSLLDESSKFKVIFDNIDDGVILIDANLNIQLINPGACKISGWTSEEAMGLAFNNVIKLLDDKGEPIADSDNPIFKAFQTKESVRDDDLVIEKNKYKTQIPIAITVSPMLDNRQNITAVVAVISDVTQKRNEDHQRADFISTASHEMRTPVATIEGYLSLALNEKVANIDSRARGYLEKAHAATQHLGQLFQDLLSSSKAEDGRITSHPSLVNLGQLLEDLSDGLRLVAQKKNLDMQFISGDVNNGVIDAASNEGGERVVQPTYYVYVDPDRFREVITNLFDNAVKYTPSGKITLGLTGNDQIVQCYIGDTGPGIPPEDIPHLFQKFYRVDNSATRTIGGTGLGLFITRKIVELYNGRIWVESKLGVGSTFYINLPRLSDAKVQELMNNVTQENTGNLVTPNAQA